MDNQQFSQQAAPQFAQAPAQKKSSSALVIIFAILAVAGIGFGVFGMIQGSKSQNTSDFKVSVTKADGSTSTLEADKVEIKDGEIIVKQIEEMPTPNAASGPYVDNGYFYVPKWGVKYKLPDNIVNFGYAVDQKNQGDSYGNYVIGVNAILKEDYVEDPQDMYYADIFSCSELTVRVLEDNKSGWNQGDFNVEFNNHKFVIFDTWRIIRSGEDECFAGPERADRVTPVLKEMLNNPELM